MTKEKLRQIIDQVITEYISEDFFYKNDYIGIAVDKIIILHNSIGTQIEYPISEFNLTEAQEKVATYHEPYRTHELLKLYREHIFESLGKLSTPRLITYDDIFCRLRNIYTDKIYTDKPHGLSDKDIGLLARGVEALLPDEPRLMEECEFRIEDKCSSPCNYMADCTGKKPSVRSSQ